MSIGDNMSKGQASSALLKLQKMIKGKGIPLDKSYSYEELREHIFIEQNKDVEAARVKGEQNYIQKIAQESDVLIEGKTFHNFFAREPWQHNLLLQMTDFVSNVNETNKNIILSGDYGCGKTHLCCSALNLFSEGVIDGIKRSILAKQWESIMDELWSKDESRRRKLRRIIENADVLFIDEVGANEVAPMHQQLKELGRLIRVRGNKRKITLLATNHSIESLPQILGEFVMGGLQEHGLVLVGVESDFNANYNQRKDITKVTI